MIFLIAGIAEAHRLPFDLPEAESELVAGYHSEYSAMKFGMFFLGEYLGITLISAMIVTLFFGGWLGPWLPPLALVYPEDFFLYLLFHPAPGLPAETALRPAHGLGLETDAASGACKHPRDGRSYWPGGRVTLCGVI